MIFYEKNYIFFYETGGEAPTGYVLRAKRIKCTKSPKLRNKKRKKIKKITAMLLAILTKGMKRITLTSI